MNGKIQYIKTPEAARKANVTNVTIYNWIRDFGIGKKIGGRWYVDPDKLQQVIDGEITYENQGRPKEEK